MTDYSFYTYLPRERFDEQWSFDGMDLNGSFSTAGSSCSGVLWCSKRCSRTRECFRSSKIKMMEKIEGEKFGGKGEKFGGRVRNSAGKVRNSA